MLVSSTNELESTVEDVGTWEVLLLSCEVDASLGELLVVNVDLSVEDKVPGTAVIGEDVVAAVAVSEVPILEVVKEACVLVGPAVELDCTVTDVAT